MRFCRLNITCGHTNKPYYGRGLCLSCWKKQARTKESSKRKTRQNNWRHNTGIEFTTEQFESLKINQNGLCLICKKEPKRLVVDHCHKTKEIRGLLCVTCNASLEWLQKNKHKIKNYLNPVVYA